MQLINTSLAMIGPWQILLLIFAIILLFVSPFYLIFYKRSEKEHSIPIFSKILLIIPSFTWIGVVIGIYIKFRKKNYSGNKTYKFDKSTRSYATFLIALSIISVILYLVAKGVKE